MSGLPVRTLKFQEAIERTKGWRRNLLLGNGFSISAHTGFGYTSLYEMARPISESVRSFFDNSGDFELALEAVRRRYGEISADQAEALDFEIRKAFLDALSMVHPPSSMDLNIKAIDQCAAFLEHFVGTKLGDKIRGRVYTTNYDLLLYWVIVRTTRRLVCYDSHNEHGNWTPNEYPQLVYLHGALHLFRQPAGQVMLRYKLNSNLLHQIKDELYRGRFPAIIAEGTSEGKLARIEASKYLKRMRRHFKNDLEAAKDAVLFIHGHSLTERDKHILDLIGDGKVGVVCIGAYGGEQDHSDKIRHWASTWGKARHDGGAIPPEIWVYDTKEFSPWKTI